MQLELTRFPDLETLTHGLTLAFRSSGNCSPHVTVLDREPNVYASTFPSEIVTCRLGDGQKLRLFCKYGTGPTDPVYGHRGGVAYEAAVHRYVLQPLDGSAPTFYGTNTDLITGATWLILEWVDGGVWVDKTLAPGAMSLAARWLGRFHAANEARLATAPIPFLNTYDAGYYRGWARRTSRFAGHRHQCFPWLAKLCARNGEFWDHLLKPAPTVIHGEFYPHNILIREGTLYPVDWESAAVAPGEIDLASLTEEWSAEIVRDLEREYQQARWPEGPPSNFERTLAAARLYMQFRWLGDREEWTTDESCLWRFEQLRSAGEQLGLI